MKVFSKVVARATKIHRNIIVKKCTCEAVVKYEKALRKLAYN